MCNSDLLAGSGWLSSHKISIGLVTCFLLRSCFTTYFDLFCSLYTVTMMMKSSRLTTAHVVDMMMICVIGFGSVAHTLWLRLLGTISSGSAGFVTAKAPINTDMHVFNQFYIQTTVIPEANFLFWNLKLHAYTNVWPMCLLEDTHL